MDGSKKFQRLIETILLYNPSARIEQIKKAWELQQNMCNTATDAETGLPFWDITLELIEVLADLKVDSTTIITALLSGLSDKEPITREETEKMFGKDEADLLEKLNKFKGYEKNIKKEKDLQKLFLAMTKDPVLIFIILGKRLVISRHLEKMSKEKSRKYSEETLNIFAPIAHKIGINKIKSELEDKAFLALKPEIYNEINSKLKKKESGKQLDEYAKQIQEKLNESNIKANVFGRSKHIYSIYRKMKNKNRTFEEIRDVTGLRIVANSDKECYEVLGLVHSLFKPLPGEFNDYIAKPKANLYQSLHTSLLSPEKKIFEVQIRTREMDRIAEQGIAAHWKYKGHKSDKKYDKKINWLKQMIEWRKDLLKSKEFIDSLKVDLFDDEIFVFTPKDEVIELPEDSTVLDFAYAIHSDVGHKCEKAKVNNKIAPLSYTLRSGDKVEITTSDNQVPKRSWLSMVKTSKAKSKIRQKLQIQFRKTKSGTFRNVFKTIKIKGNQTAVRLAKCCMPIPGDPVIGFHTTKRKTIIHRKDCINAIKHNNKMKVVKVDWDEKTNGTYMVEIKVEAKDEPGLLGDILKVLSTSNIALRGADAKTIDGNKTRGIFTIETKNVGQLEKVIERIGKLGGVQTVERG